MGSEQGQRGGNKQTEHVQDLTVLKHHYNRPRSSNKQMHGAIAAMGYGNAVKACPWLTSLA